MVLSTWVNNIMSLHKQIESLQDLVPAGGWRITQDARLPPQQKQQAGWPNRVLMLIGFYEGLAGVLNSTGLPLDAALARNLTQSTN